MADRSLVFWQRLRRLLQVTLVLGVFLGVWLVALRPESEPAVLPDTSEQFSLDLVVNDLLDHDVVYAVEQRARPMYRIFGFDPATGDEETIYTVPEDAIVYGIALSPDRSQLAVAYSVDFSIEGNGIWLLDLDSLDFTEVAATEDGVYLTELDWSLDGTGVFATHVDRRTGTEKLSVASIAMASGEVDVVLENAITPGASVDGLFYLTVDEEKARRSVGLLGENDTATIIEVLAGVRDLDHLTIRAEELLVAVLEEPDEGLLSLGTPAAAHGNHNIRSSWWTVDETEEDELTDFAPIIVYDASATDSGAIVYATLEGLSIGDGERVDVIKSRAIRFVTG